MSAANPSSLQLEQESIIAEQLHPFHSFNRKYMDEKRGKREGALLAGQYRYVGREWLFEKVEKWLDAESGERTMLLLGEAGFGKSAFVAQLVDERMKDRVVAYHFCSDELKETLEQDKFIYGLFVSLAKIDGFKTQLMKLLEEEPSGADEGLA